MNKDQTHWASEENMMIKNANKIIDKIKKRILLVEMFSDSIVSGDCQQIPLNSNFTAKHLELKDKKLSDLIALIIDKDLEFIKECELPIASYKNSVAEFEKFDSSTACNANQECEKLLDQYHEQLLACSISGVFYEKVYIDHLIKDKYYAEQCVLGKTAAATVDA
jgi:hypothetical protein